MEYELYICPVAVGPFRDFSPTVKFKKIYFFLRCIAVSVFRLKKIFFEVFRCFVSLFRGLEMPSGYSNNLFTEINVIKDNAVG